MPCRYIDLGGGKYAIARVAARPSRQCSVCGLRTRDYVLCDYPAGGSKTCDALVCRGCAWHLKPDTDFCPAHAKIALTPEGKRL